MEFDVSITEGPPSGQDDDMPEAIKDTEPETLQNYNDIIYPEDEEEGFITVDKDENINYINKTLCSQLGYDRLELLGESFRKLTVDTEFDRIRNITKERKDGRASTYQLVLLTKEGKQCYYRVSAAPLYVDSKFMGTMGIFSDITAMKEDIDNLETSVQYHELMVKYLPLGLLILDASGNIINMNSAFARITNLQQGKLLNKPVFSIEFLADLKYRYALDNLLLYQVDYDFETDAIKLENGSVFFHMQGYHLPIKSSKSYYLLVFGEISKRKKQEQEIKKKMDDLLNLENHLQETISKKEKELQEKEWQLLEQARQETNRTLLAKIAHYWRQPLNNATILIQSLQDDYSFGELNEQKFNQKVDHAVTQLDELSKTLETFRYLSNDDVVKMEFNLGEVINKAIDLLRPSCQSSDIIITTGIDDRITTVGYPRRFAQVIVNLLENAVVAHIDRKTTKPNITVKLSFKSNLAEIIISDNAGGIEADLATRIFDPYFTTYEINSQGLGLFLAKQVINEMFAGEIKYKRTMEGSDFIIKLPAAINSDS